MTELYLEAIRRTLNLDRFRGKTYGDVELPPLRMNRTESRRDISLDTRFSKNIPMRQFIVPANMLDITESRMAITSGLMGGIGIIHRFCPIDFQAQETAKVKRSHNFIIQNPVCIKPDASVAEARNIMQENKIGGVLVADTANRLLGLVTERDIEFANAGAKINQDGVMTPYCDGKLVVIPQGQLHSIEDAARVLHEKKIKKLPIVGPDGQVVGLVTRKDVRRLKQYPKANLDQNGNLLVGATIGAVGDFIERAQELIIRGRADVLVMDVTSGHSILVEKAIARLRREVGDIELVVGNIGTSEQADFLIKQGVQGIKIGIGPGSPCTTRRATGIGVSQLFAVMEIYWNLIFKYKYKPEDIPPLCADGGIKYGGQNLFALLAGASSVMMGSLFAGTVETPGDAYPKEDGHHYKPYRGMASLEALIARYEAEGIEDPVAKAIEKSPEGKGLEVRVSGLAETKIKDLIGGVQSGISHRGALSLAEFKNQNPFDKETGFTILSSAAQRESSERQGV